MDEIIVKGPISNNSYKDDYDDDGNKIRKYRFTIDSKKVTSTTPQNFYIGEGDVLILELKKVNENNYEVVSGRHELYGYKWGKNPSGLKKHIKEADIFTFIEGKIIQKQKINHTLNPANDVSINSGPSRIGYNIVLENGEFYTYGYIGEKLKKDDLLSVVMTDKVSVIVFNKTTNKKYGVKFPYYLVFLAFGILYTCTIYYLINTGTKMPNPKAGIIVIDSCLLFFGVISFFSYKQSNAAKRFLKEQLSGR